MKQSYSIKDRDKTIALYPRISREDTGKDESYSIANQKKLLTAAAKKLGFTNLLFFVDDGISGTQRDRKEFTRMLAELEKGYISAVMVKDLSRLARDHIRADTLIEEFFPEHDIRLISISEGLDTINGEDEFTPFRNLMNEWYARDISKKRKLTNIVKGNAGEPLSPPPYGYILDPENPKRWVIDSEAAAVVRRIYDMNLDGKGTDQIAAVLTSEKILSPIFYWRSKGINRSGRVNDRDPHFWNNSTVNTILSMQEYCGDVINFKTYSKSFKLKKRIPNSEENMAIFKGVHDPIVERETWERIQERRSKTRKRKTKDGEKNMFSGLLVCADCGNNLWFHFNQKNHDIKYFNCSGYNTRRGDCPTTHYIRVDFLEEVIIQEIRRLTRYARQHEAEFAELVMGHSENANAEDWERKRKELAAMHGRDKELDRLFSRIYEDNVAGKIDDERFSRMTRQYTAEQKELAEKIKALAAKLDKQDAKAVTADMFISTVRKYTRAKKLTERMLSELIDRIEVFQSEKVDGVWMQRLKIYYTCVGAIDIPDALALPEITMQTRRGVTVSYEPLRQAV
jgi:predicted site-specific integrase-resolvase